MQQEFAMGAQQESAMTAQQEAVLLVQTISGIYEGISKLPSLTPSPEVDKLFTELVNACIRPVAIDISALNKEVQDMRSKLIKLCGQAEGLLEKHYCDLLATHDNPLDHLNLFPYYSNYIKLSLLEYTLLEQYVSKPPANVAFVGSGPLPLSSVVLATRHMLAAKLHNYDLDPAANERARQLVRADPDLASRMVFHTVDVLDVTLALGTYDVVFLAALVGMDREEKACVIEHLARHMAPGAILVVRSAHGARAFLYPVVVEEDLNGFEVMTVFHPEDEVINSVIVARKPHTPGGHARGASTMMWPCKCCEMVQGLNHFGHGSMVEEVALEKLPS